jgi:protein-disulfide isomerase
MSKMVLLIVALMLGFASNSSRAEDNLVPDAVLEAIHNDSSSPASGSGALTIVEYFDYVCPYCKDYENAVERLLDEDSDIRIIYVDFPKHGALSDTAALAALASARQGVDKFLFFHQELLKKDLNLSEPVLFQAAQNAGLDVDRLKEDLKDPALLKQMQERTSLGRQAGVRITPTMIIAGYLFPGDNSYENLKRMVDYVRSKG